MLESPSGKNLLANNDSPYKNGQFHLEAVALQTSSLFNISFVKKTQDNSPYGKYTQGVR